LPVVALPAIKIEVKPVDLVDIGPIFNVHGKCMTEDLIGKYSMQGSISSKSLLKGMLKGVDQANNYICIV
jgi:hypothetical protein